LTEQVVITIVYDCETQEAGVSIASLGGGRVRLDDLVIALATVLRQVAQGAKASQVEGGED